MDLLEAMATYVRVVDAASLARAAQALRISSAAVSRQITALEEQVGVRLLVRTTRRIAETDDGRRFYQHAVRTLREAEEALASVRKSSVVEGLLNVSAPTALGLSGFPESLPELLERHPRLRIDLRLEDQAVDLVGEAVDVAIRVGLVLPDSGSVIAHPLCESERWLVASPAYLRAHGEPEQPAQLGQHDAVLLLPPGARSTLSWTFRKGASTTSVEVRGRFRSSAMMAVRSATLGGGGLAILPAFMIKRQVSEGALRRIPLGGWTVEPHRFHALYRAESKGLPRLKVFLEHAQKHLVS